MVRVGPLLSQHRQQRVVPQGLLIVEILVAASQAEDPLGQQRLHLVGDPGWVARIRQGRGNGLDEPGAPIDLSQEQQAAVAGKGAPGEVGDNSLARQAGKQQWFCGTVCHVKSLIVG